MSSSLLLNGDGFLRQRITGVVEKEGRKILDVDYAINALKIFLRLSASWSINLNSNQ